ncbi:AMP-activated protein kinase subunit gamma [Acrasis kona]|uniref:AMP-activated protein kinase subunit gamma n=1 Tax=Acrasis kona TaxID=1008807 RepID=A0AAW2ZCT4_9EUKA
MVNPQSLFSEYFKLHKITDVVGESRPVLTLNKDQTIQECISKMIEKDVRSAPVIECEQSLEQNKAVFVDYIDIVDFVIDLLLKQDKTITLETLQNENLKNAILQTKVSEVANYSKLDAYVTLPSSSTMFQVAEKLGQGNKRVVVCEQGKVLNVVTHSDVISLLKKCIDDKGAANFSDTMDALGLGIEFNSYVTEEDRAIDAFLLMRQKRISFVPILTSDSDDDRQIISVISARDISLLSHGNIDILNMPVLDFLSSVRQSNPVDKYPYLWCKHDSTLEMIVKRLKATRVHRLLMINDTKLPTAVVSVQQLTIFLTGGQRSEQMTE